MSEQRFTCVDRFTCGCPINTAGTHRPECAWSHSPGTMSMMQWPWPPTPPALDLRDWFAGMVVNARLYDTAEVMAKTAYEVADAMLAERERRIKAHEQK